MTDIAQYLENLRSPNRFKRYEACEELRVTDSLPEHALLALEEATKDPDPSVADAARRALLIHRPPPTPVQPSSHPGTSVAESTSPPSFSQDLPQRPNQPQMPSVQIPSSSPYSPEYVFALEKRIMYLEGEIATLRQGVENAFRQSAAVSSNLPNTAIISPSFLSRAFAVWGHLFVAQLIITIPIYCIIYLLTSSGY